MFSPPLPAAFAKASRAPSSIAAMSRFFCFNFLPRFTFARHMTQRGSHDPSFLTRKWFLESGKDWPQSVQVLSDMRHQLQLHDHQPGVSLSFFSSQLWRDLKLARRPSSP